MIGKLLLLGIILSVAGVLVYSQQDKLGINVNPTINAVAEDIGGLKDTTIKRVSYELEKTSDVVGDKIGNVVPNVDQLNPIPKIEDQVPFRQKRSVHRASL